MAELRKKWSSIQRRLQNEISELQKKNNSLRERNTKLKERDLALSQTCRMMADINKLYADRESVLVATVRTLTQASRVEKEESREKLPDVIDLDE